MFPVPPDLKKALEQMMAGIHDLPTAIVLFALVPAVCEELAFRGFILTGLEHGHKARAAIVMSALLFGFMHVLLSLFQQLFNATLLGLVLGLLAVRSKSLLPGVVFHAINNSMALALGFWLASASGRQFATWVYRKPEEGLYHYGIVAASVLVSAVLLTRLVGTGESGKKTVAANPDFA